MRGNVRVPAAAESLSTAVTLEERYAADVSAYVRDEIAGTVKGADPTLERLRVRAAQAVRRAPYGAGDMETAVRALRTFEAALAAAGREGGQ